MIDISVTFSQYLNYIKTAHNRLECLKVELLYPNGEVQNEITSDVSSSDGQLTVNLNNGIRRSVSLTLINPQLKYKIDPKSLWLNTKFRVYWGTVVSGEWYWILLGTFVLSNSSLVSDLSNSVLHLNGLDKFALLNGTLGGTLNAIYQIDVDSYMRNAIQATLNESGDTSPLLYDSVFEGYKIPYTIIKNRGQTYADILIELANLRSSNLYYDAWGNLNFTSGVEDLDDSLKPSQYSFYKDNPKLDVNYISGNVDYKIEDVKNSVTVFGDNINGSIVDFTLTNDNLLSPFLTSLIGFRPLAPI